MHLFPGVGVVVKLGVVKLLYLLLLQTLIEGPWVNHTEFGRAVLRWPINASANDASHYATWDAARYLRLSEEGYPKGSALCAFYPLYPLLIRVAAPWMGEDHLVAGLVLSNLFSVTAWGLFYERVRRRWGPTAAGWAIALLILFPGALFFQFPYTESLFLLLVMLLWWGLEERWWALAWVAAMLLPMTRAVGVFALLPIAWKLAQERGLGAWMREALLPSREAAKGEANRENGAGGRKTRLFETGKAAGGMGSGVDGISRAPWGLLTAPLLGWWVYLGLMKCWTGNPFEGFAAQKYWGVHAVWNLLNVPKFVMGFFTPTHWHAFTGSLLDRGVFALVLYTLPVLWRLDKGLLVWTYWLGILPAMSGTFTSFTRYASCAFPVFVALAVWLNGGLGEDRLGPTGPTSGRFWLKWALVGGFAALHVVLVWRHVNYQWAG